MILMASFARAPAEPLAAGAWPPGEPKDVWGPRGWAWLHRLAIAYPDAPTAGEASGTFARIWAFVSNLPCAECRVHATAHVAARPPPLGGSEELQQWAWEFHNAVNRRLKKRVVSYAEYMADYAAELAAASACARYRAPTA